jgi:hypothetical protein
VASFEEGYPLFIVKLRKSPEVPKLGPKVIDGNGFYLISAL